MTTDVHARDSEAGSPRRRGAPAGLLRLLPAVTLVAVMTITASAEFQLARTVLDLPPRIAWALPVAIDSYVLAAMRSGRDVLPAMSVMAGALAASMGAHLSADGKAGQPLPGHVVAPAATGIMVVLVVVAWRVHVLIEHPADTAAHAVADTSAAGAAVTPGALPPAAMSTRVVTANRASPDTAAGVSEAPPAGASFLSASSPQSAAAPPVASPSARTSSGIVAEPRPPRSDAEIITAIAGTSPSIRLLMRTYGIGQARATRLHNAARQHPSQHQRNNKSAQPENDLEKAEEGTSSEEVHNETDSDEEEQNNENQKAEASTHTCITDRVGPPSPAGPISRENSGTDSHLELGAEPAAESQAVLHAVRGA